MLLLVNLHIFLYTIHKDKRMWTRRIFTDSVMVAAFLSVV